MAATIDTTANRKQRLALQAKLKNRDGLKANLDQARQTLAEVQRRVDSFELMHGALIKPTAEFSRAAMEFSDLTNTIPNELVNSCCDRSLKDEFEVAVSVRSQLIAEHQTTREALKRAEADLASTKRRISEANGEPAILTAGQPLPWDQGVIAKAFTQVQIALGNTTVPRWAISDDMQSIAFAPSVLPSDAEFHSGQWFDDLKLIRKARVAFESTEKRLQDAEAAMADVKARMINSPV